LNVLLAAHEWGCPPWEITGSGSRLVWFQRWAAYAEQRSLKQQGDAWQTP